MTLDGLERALHAAVPRRSRVNFVRYADDFIVTGKSRCILEDHIRPTLEAFLAERGLTLSPEKTVTTHIRDGFTFLGQTFRKTGNVLRITPARAGVLALVRKVGTSIRTHVSAPVPVLVKKLSQVLRGWGNYHRHVIASDAFTRIDRYVRGQLWRMLRRRHPNKSRTWLFRHYWRKDGQRHIFRCTAATKRGRRRHEKQSRLLPAMSVRAVRAIFAP